MHFDTIINSDDTQGSCAAELQRQMKRRGLTAEQVAILAIGEQRSVLGR
jgi:hypothetical protein